MKKLIELLNNNPNIDEWKIVTNDTSSTELFFIKDKLQMNRAKDVSKINVTVYKNFSENEKKFKGSSSTVFSDVYTNKEIEEKLNQAALAASFVKNEYYELVSPTGKKAKEITSAFSQGDPVELISKLVKDLYEENHQFDSFINSTEFFLNKKLVRIVNSKGLDVEYQKYSGEIELITEAEGENESIELFCVLHFADYDSNAIKTEIKDKLEQTSLRAKAIPMPNVKDIPVILRGSSTVALWSYYATQVSAGQKYSHIHNNNIGDSVQNEDALGDLVTITMKPEIPNSTLNSYYDVDGFLMKETIFIENGKIKNLFAQKRFSDYLNIKTTGNLQNTIVNPGGKSIKELKDGPYLEIIAFSNFQTDGLTGDFGGEFRLAIYFDGEKEIPVTLGTVAGNLKTAQNDMYLSKESVKNDFFIGPKYIKFNKLTIVGN